MGEGLTDRGWRVYVHLPLGLVALFFAGFFAKKSAMGVFSEEGANSVDGVGWGG